MFAASLALLLAAQAQGAQPAPDIVVTAPRQADTAAVDRYVRGISTTTGGQLASFRDPVCPAVFGLPENYVAPVIRRLRAVAVRAGIEVAPEGCTPNVTLVVANNSLSAVQQMQRLSPRLFNGLSPAEYERLTRPGDQVRVWSLTEVVNEDGVAYQVGDNDETSAVGGAGGPDVASAVRVRSSSIITVPTQRRITQSIVVIDEQATVGKSLTQLSDYVAMRAIGGVRGDSSVDQGNSILSLFSASGEPPRSLTSLDLAYLRALDDMPGNQRAVTHMARLARVIAGEVGAQRRP